MSGSIEKEDESMRETAKVDSPSPGDLYERDGKEERRIFRKMDMHLLPFVSLLYLLSFLCVSLCCPRSAAKANSAHTTTGIGRMLVSGMSHVLPRTLELNDFALTIRREREDCRHGYRPEIGGPAL